MPRPSLILPIDDVKGLPTLLGEGLSQSEIAEYYNSHEYFQRAGIKVSQQRISDAVARADIPSREI
jgi:hypothetical protein